MKKQFTKTLATLLLGITIVSSSAVASEKIDRRKVVTRHNPHVTH